jgi:hypothetical protein
MSDYSVDVTNSGTVGADVTIEGLDNISVDSTVTLQPLTSTVTLEPLTTTSTITLEPLTSTVTSSSSVDFDLEPVAVDSCVRVELAPLPPTRLRTPWEQRVGMSVLGVELLAVTWRGETQSIVEPAPRRPLLLGMVDEHDHEDHDGHSHDDQSGHGHKHGHGPGLVVRVKP